ncbi:MAG: flavin reductase [Erysipelotrichaceae bacterium]|nr:flavin reductase [Erysipelotrichaceae bacterium]
MELKINPFEKFNNEWAILTAGNKDDFNGMTISWGSMGTIWGKDVITVYVRPDRYTYEFIKKYDEFSVSFFPAKYHESLGVMGSLSGRDQDKVKIAKLEAEEIDGTVAYKEASEVFVCKKIYMNQLNYDEVPEEGKKIYQNGIKPHYLVMGEVKRYISR